jgi:2-succinyl-5-enolpyruvyl-6-hydroxy-3-cyclohexene-1-carboxylate synthase
MSGFSTDLPEPLNPMYAWTRAFVDELARSGLRHAVVCPGSRSTPLALTLATAPTIRLWMHVDERSAAFFALGMAKRLQQPVALLCTSGTAAANFLPAVVEAHLTHVPLLVITADRPPELRDCGAPQAIDQQRLYGSHAKWFVDTALPEATNEALRAIRALADRAFALTLAIPAGPVHVNMPLREPLTPAPIASQPLPPLAVRDPLAWQGRPDGLPYTSVWQHPAESLAPELLQQMVTLVQSCPHGLIVVGPQTDPALVDPLLLLARQTGYPILADPLSQIRGHAGADDLALFSYDAFLHTERFCQQFQPQLVLRFGPMPTAKTILLYLKRYPACPQVVVDSQHGWEEPMQQASQMIATETGRFCQQLAALLKQVTEAETGDWLDDSARSLWTRAWLAAEQVTRTALATAITSFAELFEGRIFTELADLLPARALLYVGNSMPVRDMDTFFWPSHTPVYALGNRGASGIDGVISSALGASAAGGSEEPAVLVIGDLSFFHDLNGLLAAHLHKLNLVIVLVQNNGGGIFSFLPQAAFPEHFEQLFGTPTDLNFAPVVSMYGGIFERVTGWDAFRHALSQGLHTGGLHVIEVPTERTRNVALHRELWQVVEQALQQAGLFNESEA